MAITGDIFKGLIFGNVNSINYGIYITGEAVYNAPERAVELVSVPNRNGSIAIDQGYWENIEVSYPAGTFAENQVDFAKAISDFRNALASQIGYQRLTDSYNPNEYRMGMFVSAFEVTPVQLGQAGQFELKFNCKPQRWLLTGEQPVTVANNDTLTNPTLYDASPLLAVEGYGTIDFNNYRVEITDDVMGEVMLIDERSVSDGGGVTFTATSYNVGDIISVGSCKFTYNMALKDSTSTMGLFSISSQSSGVSTTSTRTSTYTRRVNHEVTGVTFTAGTSATATKQVALSTTFETSGGTTTTANFTVTLKLTYDGDDRITVKTTFSSTTYYKYTSIRATLKNVVVDSSVSVLGTPTYIDCDLGECYKIENNTVVDLNAYIDLGSDLPKLASGSNTIGCALTITDLKITPRWWQL